MIRRRIIWYHHAILAERVKYDEIIPSVEFSSDSFFIRSYRWLESQVGFWPIFLAVGHPNDVAMTGYSNQWRRKWETKEQILFSFRDVEGVYTDYLDWHFALNGYGNDPSVPLKDWEIRRIFKPSWGKAKWRRFAGKHWHRVQLVAPKLDLRKACRVWVRNKNTKKRLEDMGFTNVRVKRIDCDAC